MTEQCDYEFGLLLEAILREPEKIRDIVNSTPGILEATNCTGENVLRWCAVENYLDEVEMLRSLGSSIQPAALSEAVGLGYTFMVGLLLELGAEPDLVSCRRELSSKFNRLTKRQKHIICSHFRDYGYEI